MSQLVLKISLERTQNLRDKCSRDWDRELHVGCWMKSRALMCGSPAAVCLSEMAGGWAVTDVWSAKEEMESMWASFYTFVALL